MNKLFFLISLLSFSCQVMTVREDNVKEETKIEASQDLTPSEKPQKEKTIFDYSIAGICWDMETQKNITFKNLKLQGVTEDYNLVFQRENEEPMHYSNCIYEIEEPLKIFNPDSDHLNFSCFIHNGTIYGTDYTLVKSFNSKLFWILSEASGQNLIISTKNCDISNTDH